MDRVGRAVRHGGVAAGDDDLLGAVDSLLRSWGGGGGLLDGDGSSAGLHLNLTVTNLVGDSGGHGNGASREGSESE